MTKNRYAQYEAERRKQREEEKAKKAEEGGSILKEREARRKEEEEARKKALEDKKQELLEKRREEDEARKQKNKELSEAREKRILEERRKREIAIEKLKQKPAHDLLTSAFFQQWDQEEGERKMREELEEYPSLLFNHILFFFLNLFDLLKPNQAYERFKSPTRSQREGCPRASRTFACRERKKNSGERGETEK